jgi:hypothetical protein
MSLDLLQYMGLFLADVNTVVPGQVLFPLLLPHDHTSIRKYLVTA